MLDRKNICVVGGAGFIGSHLCEELLKENNIICIDDYSTGREENIDHLLSNAHFEFIRHDISAPLNFKDFPKIERFRLAHVGVQEIYLCASPTSPRATSQFPIETIATNVSGTKHILDCALNYHSKVVFISDAVCYGDLPQQDFRIEEDFIGPLSYLSPSHYYAQSKRSGEQLMSVYSHLYSLETKIVRLFTVYGPRMYLDDSRMIPDWIASAIQERPLIMPSEYVSSFLYVSDAIDGLIKIMNCEKSGIWNLGHGSSYPLQEVAQKIISLTKSSSIIKNLTTQEADADIYELWKQHCRIPSLEKIKDEIGWFPFVLLDDGLEKTIQFMEHLKGEKRLIK